MIIINSTSKWLEFYEMMRTTASQAIKVPRSCFARFELPIQVVSDQGTTFTSSDFRHYLKQNGISQYFSPTYHPSSNGAAENSVKLCKSYIKKAYRESHDLDVVLNVSDGI